MPITISGSTGIAGVDGSASTPAVQGTDTNTGIAFPAADTVAVATGGTERMRIDSSGNVGIGTSSPGYKLTVNGNISTENYNILSGSASYSLSLSAGTAFNTNGAAIALRGSTAGYNNHGMEFYAGGSERARIDSSGALLVGRTAALSGHTFQNAGGATTYRPTGTSSAGVHHFYSDVGGTASLKSYTQADGTYTNLSDQRFKTDITPARSYLGDLLKIQVVNYRWKNDDSAEKKLGVIAQQVEQVFPAMVKTVFGNTQTGETQKMIPYEVFVPMLITAIQELKAENDDLKARLTALEAK